MASAVGHISGGHFNPAVTFAFVVMRRMQPALALVYWTSQLLAATLAALLLRWVLEGELVDRVRLGAPGLGLEVDPAAGLVVEAILTFFLVWVILATTADPRGQGTTSRGSRSPSRSRSTSWSAGR